MMNGGAKHGFLLYSIMTLIRLKRHVFTFSFSIDSNVLLQQ